MLLLQAAVAIQRTPAEYGIFRMQLASWLRHGILRRVNRIDVW
jgi:hypothetical protein